jgi:hypothetical protein
MVTMYMQLFNTVLIPHEFVGKAATDFARKNFSNGHNGYCLDVDGHLPHVTIAQLKTPDDFDISKLYNEISKLNWSQENELGLGNYYHDDPKRYNGVEVIMSPELRSMHDNVVTMYEGLDLNVENLKGDDYWPHLTFSKNPNRLPEPIQLPIALTGKSAGWRLEVGHAGKHWTYLGAYNPK